MAEHRCRAHAPRCGRSRSTTTRALSHAARSTAPSAPTELIGVRHAKVLGVGRGVRPQVRRRNCQGPRALLTKGLRFAEAVVANNNEGDTMGFERSRRDFITQGSMLVALSTGIVRPSWAQGSVEAETTFGRVRGTEVKGIKAFKGIPYGASTAGANRFMPPKDPAKWTGVRDALAYGSRAPQREPSARREADEQGAGAGQQETEDCLVLNVWTPGIDDGGKRPVALWCHGGGFNTGSGAAPVN